MHTKQQHGDLTNSALRSEVNPSGGGGGIYSCFFFAPK